MATNINVGSAYLTIIPSAKGFVRALKKQLAEEGYDKLGEQAAKKVEKGFNRSRAVKNIGKSFTGMFASVTSLGQSAMLDMFVAVGAGAVSALAPLSGLLLGVPALATAAAGAIGALKLALNGVGAVLSSSLLGDAEGFSEGLKELTPSAAKVVGELGPIFNDLNNTVQEAFFKPMVTSAKGLGEELKGPVRTGLKTIAGSLGTVIAGTLAWAKSAQGAQVITKVTEQTALFIERAGAGLPTLLQGILDLASVTSGDLGTGIATVSKRFGEWLSQISSDGRAQAWFDQALDTAKQLASVAQDLLRTLLAVFKAGGSDGGTLEVLANAADAMADWAESAKGQETLNDIFKFFGTILREVVKAIGHLVAGFAIIATWFNKLSPETQETIAKFIAWSIVLAPFAGRLIAIAGLVKSLSLLVTTLGRIIVGGVIATGRFTKALFIGKAALTAKSGAAAKAGVAVRKFIGVLGRGIVALGRWAAAAAVATAKVIASFARMAAAVAVSAAKGAAAYLRSAAMMIAVGARMAASAVLAGARVAAAWALMAAKAVVSGARQVGALLLSGAKWIWLGIVAMANAIRVAASWFIALGPIGWIILALIAIAAVVIVFWDEIKAAFIAFGSWLWGYIEPYWNAIVSFFQTVWTWIKDALNWDELVALVVDFAARMKAIWDGFWSIIKEILSATWDLIVGIVTGNTDKARNALGRLADIPGKFADWFGGAYNSVKEWLGKALDYISELPSSILDKLGDLGSLLWNAGKDLIQGLINGIKDSFGTVKDLLGDLTSQLPDWKGPKELDKIILEQSGELVVGGFVKGIRKGIPTVKSALAGLTADIPVAVNSNTDAVQAPDPGGRGIHIENYSPQAADNRFTADQLWAQAKMVYS
jgi:hypothetical protein